MSETAGAPDAARLREQLMAAEPTRRVAGLHALDCACARSAGASNAKLVHAISEFVARGMPFYSSADPHYLAWVERALEYWERLQRQLERPAAAQGHERRGFARAATAPT